METFKVRLTFSMKRNLPVSNIELKLLNRFLKLYYETFATRSTKYTRKFTNVVLKKWIKCTDEIRNKQILETTMWEIADKATRKIGIISW